MQKPHKLAVYIGRFSPVHNGHLDTIRTALTVADHLVILVGSANEAPNIRNPWSFEQRNQMITNSLFADELARIRIEPHSNFISMLQWELQIQQKVYDTFENLYGVKPNKSDIVLIGHKKDHTSEYLDNFPQWDFIETEHVNKINATNVRNDFFINGVISDQVSNGVAEFLDVYRTTEMFNYIVKEYEFQIKHDAMWASAPYPVVFHTVDAVVVQQGHVLLIQRKNHPGKDTWALPGGYVNQNEPLVQSMIRELREETGLKVPTKVLMGSIKKDCEYDEPNRSTRGRIFTRAYLIELNAVPEGLPRVRGQDDAIKAHWFPIYEFVKMRNKMFEDHYMIIRDMLGI